MAFMLLSVMIFLTIVGLLVIPFVKKSSGSITRPPQPRKKLDTAGIVTNVILIILYIPLSLVGSMLGMVSEGYMDGVTFLQSILLRTLEILGFFTPLVAFGGIVASALLRRRGRSVLSFYIQFSGLAYLAVAIGLIFILDFV